MFTFQNGVFSVFNFCYLISWKFLIGGKLIFRGNIFQCFPPSSIDIRSLSVPENQNFVVSTLVSANSVFYSTTASQVWTPFTYIIGGYTKRVIQYYMCVRVQCIIHRFVTS